ncbi:MAG: DUF5791 family protein [Haloarculaceae archaeon]
MFHELVPDPGERSPEEIEGVYAEALASVVESVGVEAAVAETDLDEATVAAARDGDLDAVTLEEGAAILALDESAPPAADIAALARDALLMGMTTAVMDVETLASDIGGELEAREIQQKVEGRFPISLAEYALLSHYIQRGSP